MIKWIKGLVSAIIGGAATSVTLMITNPIDFNIDTGLKKLLSVMVVSAIVSAAMYLKQSPIPNADHAQLPKS